MIYISAYNSLSLDENSLIRFGESGITYITITTSNEDISAALSEEYHSKVEGERYPTWDKLALCLRTDWKRLGCWAVKEGDVLREPLQKALHKCFDSPEVVTYVFALIDAYASYMKQDRGHYRTISEHLSDMYCLNKDEYNTLHWALGASDEFIDEAGLEKLREALLIGAITNVIELVQWEYYH